jgi:hypothetical protein
VTVALGHDRHEQLASRDQARVDGDPCDLDVIAVERAADGGGDS